MLIVLEYLLPPRGSRFHLYVSVCLSLYLFLSLFVNPITQKQVIKHLLKFYEMVEHKPEINRLDFEWH